MRKCFLLTGLLLSIICGAKRPIHSDETEPIMKSSDTDHVEHANDQTKVWENLLIRWENGNANPKRVCVATTLRLHSEPDPKSKTVGNLKQGEIVFFGKISPVIETIDGINGRWAEVI